MKKSILIGFLLMSLQIHAKMNFKHGVYLSKSLGSLSSDISGKHQDISAFIGNNPSAITEKNANVDNAKISDYFSFGYNLRYIPKTGFGYEFGVYSTKIKIPVQMAALIHDDGTAFKQNTATGPVDIVVDSPSSSIKTIDVYIGGVYNFPKFKQVYTPYINLGYAKTKGNWNKSYYSGKPKDLEYGTKGKTGVSGSYISFKVGMNFMENYNLELEYASHKIHADSFRSFNINGSNSSFNRTSLNFIYNF